MSKTAKIGTFFGMPNCLASLAKGMRAGDAELLNVR